MHLTENVVRCPFDSLSNQFQLVNHRTCQFSLWQKHQSYQSIS